MQKNLIASVALFRGLYDNDKDIYDVLAELIKSAIVHSNSWYINTQEATQLLDEVFGFDIPEAVVRACIHNRLYKKDFLSLDNGIYSVKPEFRMVSNQIYQEYEKTETIYDEIMSELISFIEKRVPQTIGEKERAVIAENFKSFMINQSADEHYLAFITAFILNNKHNSALQEKLKTIEEGVLLYTGILYTGNINELGSWNTEFTVFLDTEHLFNALGLNGTVYKQVFDDFYGLVQEINRNNTSNGNKKKITLKYFEDTRDEINSFFHFAELIVEGKKNLEPSKSAMISIVNGCKNKSDVVRKKNQFFIDLGKKDITIEDNFNYYQNPAYNIESTETLEKIQVALQGIGKEYDREECSEILKTFTKINALRKGSSDNGFERAGYIIVTGRNLVKAIAYLKDVKVNERDIPFATSIEFITNKFWFKLKKGFGLRNAVPRSFDVITKAQVVLSSQLSNRISRAYRDLIKDVESGVLQEHEAITLNHYLREHNKKPEDIQEGSLEEVLAFLNEDVMEQAKREKSILEKKVQEGLMAIEELKRIKKNEFNSQKKAIRSKVNNTYVFSLSLVSLGMLFSFTAAMYIIIKYYKGSDSVLSIIFGVIGVVGFLAMFINKDKITKYFKLKALRRYKNSINILKK